MPEVSLANGTAQRILYTSVNASGAPIAVSGMVFLPAKPTAPAPIVAWAHPTLGQAAKCAPSRSANPLNDMQLWLDEMLGRGWVVTATDYAGLGTPGPKSYLLGEQSAQDLVNSVRAGKSVAQSVADAATSDDWVLWSHSQGGQAALWAAAKAPELAPELRNLGVATAAPAAELAEIMDAQWNTNVAWVIGPEATQTFVDAYPNLDVTAALSGAARDDLGSLEQECILGEGLQAEVLSTFDQNFFANNPSTDPAWRQIVAEQTPPPPPAEVPMLLVQGTADEVVLASTNALLQTSWCAQGVNMATLWLGEVNHMKAAVNGGPTVVQWAADRFAGVPQTPTCAFPPPVTPATAVD
jgi:pimeloyl-ACP methyl ester carboxylesterase